MSKLQWIRSQFDVHGTWPLNYVLELCALTMYLNQMKDPERSTSSQRISCEVRFARMDVFAGCETHQPE